MNSTPLLDPVRFAAAWAAICNVPPTIPSETDYKMRLISKWTRNGHVPTLEEAEEMERMDYIGGAA